MARHDYKSFSARLHSRAGKVRDVATQDLSLVCCLAANYAAFAKRVILSNVNTN